MKNFTKKVLIAAVMAMSVCSAFAQTTIKHIVDRGETLTSIAKKYSTTEAKIIELNPDAAQFVYVGMELIVPVENQSTTETSEVTTVANKLIEKNENPIIQNVATETTFTNNDYDKWNFALNMSYGFAPTTEDGNVKTSAFAYVATVGANYNITKSFYVGARIGYGYCQNHIYYSEIGNSVSYDTDNHSIIVPVVIGYRLYLSNNFAFVPYAGLDINCLLKSTTETRKGTNKEKSSVKIKDRFGANGRLGLRVSLWGLTIGGAYVFSFDDNYGDNNGYPEISIGWDF